MMKIEHSATHAPIHVQLLPNRTVKAPIGPRRAPFPIANSQMRRGTDHATRKMTHGIRKVPPPFVAAIRGKRQMFPVPTAMLSMAIMSAQRLEKLAPRLVDGSVMPGALRPSRAADRNSAPPPPAARGPASRRALPDRST